MPLASPSIVRTAHLVLRPFRNGDQESLTRLLQSLNDRSFFDVGGRKLSPARLSAKIIKGSAHPHHGLSLAVVPTGKRNPIGGASLILDTEHHAEIGLWLSPQYQGKTLGREVLQALLQIGFEKIGCPCIHGSCLENNHASRRLMESCGMTLQCTLAAEDDKGHLVRRVSYRLENSKLPSA